MSADRRIAASCLAVLSLLAASVSAAPRRPIRFERLSLEQGLSQSAVHRVLQDSRGYVWMATEDGLNRYDGTAFKVYRHDATREASLPAAFLWDLAEDAAETSGSRPAPASSPGSEPPTPCSVEPLAGRHIRALRYSANANALWIGTRDAGLFRLDLATGQVTRLATTRPSRSSLVDDRIYALTLDHQGRLWVGTDRGLDRLDPAAGGFVHFGPEPADPRSLSDAKVRAILEDDSGTLWVGTAAGLNRGLSAEGLRTLPPPAGVADEPRQRHRSRAAPGLRRPAVGRDLPAASTSLTRRARTFAHYRQDPKDLRPVWPTTTSCLSPRTEAA